LVSTGDRLLTADVWYGLLKPNTPNSLLKASVYHPTKSTDLWHADSAENSPKTLRQLAVV